MIEVKTHLKLVSKIGFFQIENLPYPPLDNQILNQLLCLVNR